MNCPNDNAVLQMTVREGIEIDYCPTCRGVWLDRGELDKLIERSSSMGMGARPSDNDNNSRHDDDDDRHRYDNQQHQSSHYDGHSQPHHKKKEGFMSDLFDF